MNSGMHKPPLLPKPKLPHYINPGQSPMVPRKDGLSHPSPGTQRKLKPVLAPKPSPSKLISAAGSKQLTPKSLHQTSSSDAPRSVGLYNSQNELHHEPKKPDWDYVIPICLCNKDNCICVTNTPANREKMEKDLKTLHKGKSEENRKPVVSSRKIPDNSQDKAKSAECQEMNTSCTHSHLTNHQSSQETQLVYENLKTYTNSSTSKVTVQPMSSHRTQRDEENHSEILKSAPGQGPKEDALGSRQISVPQPRPVPVAPRKPIPVPVPRKSRTAVVDHQEKVEKEREESVSQDGREINIKEVAVSSDGKGTSSLSVSAPDSENKQPVFLSARRACAPPALPSRKKPFRSQLDKVPASAPQILPKDVKERDLGRESSIHERDVSFDKENKEILKKEKGDQEKADNNLTYHSPHSILLTQSELNQSFVAAEENEMAKVPPKKSHRKNNPLTHNQNKVFTEEKEAVGFEDYERRHVHHLQDFVVKERKDRELPLPPYEKSSSNFSKDEKTKHSRSSLSKAKSFSGADTIHSKTQRTNSFRKLLDSKLSMMALHWRMDKEGQSPDSTANDNEQSVDKDEDECQDSSENKNAERKFSCPFIEVEQNVDGEEGEALYEEILDNNDVEKSGSSPQVSYLLSKPGENSVNDDEGIYEEQEPYMILEENHQWTPTDYDRSSVDEEVVFGPPSDEGSVPNTSDEEGEDDSSSVSSKGDPEPPDKSKMQSEKKKNKIYNIAKEIMTSESVFVDVLKLLHVDFRDAVSKASCQSGKPVIEDRLLNQILYTLPQLYELNKNLLDELRERVAIWNENAQVADIFLKKGPYLKMYSTYIREFDRNVTLLDEQTKKNPAFGAVVREFEASPRCANLALKHYLLKPVQRIPQYQLLLTDYLKNLSEDAHDYEDTQAALAKLKEVASHANDFIKQEDNSHKVINVQCSLIGHHEIVQPGRIYLKEGILMKLSRKVMQPRMFFLFNDVLLYTKPIQSGQYKLKNMLLLTGMKVSKPSQEAYQNELNIVSVERSFILSASSAKERDEWLEAISTAISEHTKKKISFIPGKTVDMVEQRDAVDGAPLGSKAPIWIPDKRATMCMICTCKFTQTWRRHHCRACGKIVCQSCSSKEYELKYLKYKLARVCDQCFQVLQEQEGKGTQPYGKRSTFAFNRKQKWIPAALKEVTANTDNSSMSGYLQMSKSNKKHGKRLWFVIKDKVLYTYAASEDVAALESQPLLGFAVKENSSQKSQFKLYHHDKLYYVFKADNIETAQRWIESFKEAAVL